MINLNYAIPNVGAEYVIPAGNNGNHTMIAVDSKQEFINRSQKIVINNANYIDIGATLTCLAYSVMANNVDAVTDPEFEICCKAGIQHAVRFKIHNNLISGGVRITHRPSDIWSPADILLATGADNANNHVIDAAKKISMWIETEGLHYINNNGRDALLCLIANALHRKLDDGHNWKTASTKNVGTIAYRCLGVKSNDRPGFNDFMNMFGHDLFHYMDTNTISNIAGYLVGETEHNIVGECFGTQPGVNNAIVNLSSIVRMPTSATDRYPPNTMGISSIIISIPLCIAMNTALFEKALCTLVEHTDVVERYAAILNYFQVNGKNVSRQAVLATRSALAPYAAVAIGFAEDNVKYDVEEHPSLKNFLDTMFTQRSIGVRMSKIVRGIVVDMDVVMERVMGNFIVVPNINIPRNADI